MLNKSFQGKVVPRDEGGEADGQEGEEGHANGGRRRVVEQVVGGPAHVVRHRRRRGQAGYQGVGHHLSRSRKTFRLLDRSRLAILVVGRERGRSVDYLVSGEVDDGRRLPPGDEVPAGAEPVRVARHLRRGVQERDDGHAQAVAARQVKKGSRSDDGRFQIV